MSPTLTVRLYRRNCFSGNNGVCVARSPDQQALDQLAIQRR